jgi:hypothetical protein
MGAFAGVAEQRQRDHVTRAQVEPLDLGLRFRAQASREMLQKRPRQLEAWLPHAVSLTGLSPRFITAELTMADSNPAMAELRPLTANSLTSAERDIDDLSARSKVA